MSAIMMDDQAAIQHYIDHFKGDPLTLQLTIFRATCRPPNQNAQIVQARFKSRQLLDIILKDNDLTNRLVRQVLHLLIELSIICMSIIILMNIKHRQARNELLQQVVQKPMIFYHKLQIMF